MNRTIKRILVVACVVGLAGCQSHAERAWYDPLNLQQEMPPRDTKTVQVVPSETSFALRFASGQATLSEPEKRAALGFLERRATERTDEVFVDFGLMVETTELALARRTVIAGLVRTAGLDPARVRVRANVAHIAEHEINLTVRRYLLTMPGCPDFTSRAGRTFDNRPHSNWGCANAINFAQMLAEPKDLEKGRGDTLADGEAMVLGIQRYRAGETRALDVDATNTAESHGEKGSSGGGGNK